VQKLRQVWDHLMFRSGEDVDDFAFYLSGLVQQLARHDNNDIDEQKVVEKYLHVIPKKYTQIALSMESLLDLSTLPIEEVIGSSRRWTTTMKRRPPTSSPAMASFTSPRSSGSLARRRRSRWAHLHPRTTVNNRVGRASLAAAGAMAEPAVEKQEFVAVGNAR
jgi:hypothetical protein